MSIISSLYDSVYGVEANSTGRFISHLFIELHMSDTTPAPIHPHDVEDDRYQRTMIYEILCNVTGERYVGSTILTLKKRMYLHVSERSKCCSRQIIDRGSYKASVIESRPCKTKRESLTLEGEWQRRYKATYGDLFVNKQMAGVFYRDNPESKKMYDKEWYANHQEEQRAYRETHKEEKRAHYVTHKEKVRARKTRPWTCEWCGKTMQFNSKSKHKRTCKHRPM